MSERLLGTVLCGGASSRMGREKAALLWDGQTLLNHALGRLRALCGQVAVSGDTTVQHDAISIADPIAHRGPAVGIAASLRYARDHDFDACLVTPVDMPLIGRDDLGMLRDGWSRTRRLSVVCGDRLEPLLAVYPVDLWADLEHLATSADRSLSRWIKSQDHVALTVSADRLQNINTPQDYSNHVS